MLKTFMHIQLINTNSIHYLYQYYHTEGKKNMEILNIFIYKLY